MNKIGQVMLYVENQEQALQFWTEKVGFQLIANNDLGGGMRSIEISPSVNAQTTIVLHDKNIIAKMSPELNLGTPSLMFHTEKSDELYAHLQAQHVTVGESGRNAIR